MIMQKTLTRHGNSYALVIDKPIMDLLRITPETPFEIMSDGQCLVLTPIREPKEEKKFQKALETLHDRFGRAMKKLAE
jgi:antitoxin component of MazEF toxin-antitoxin module